MVFQQWFSKPVLLNLPLFLTNYSSFPTLLAHFHLVETCPRLSYPKKGDKSNPLNYRPIAITSLISKTMETIITKQLLTFLETNNLLSDHQYGFQKARSTGDLFAYAVHVWSSALESSGESRVISLDISNAFDRVLHKGLLAKLPIFGLNQTLINWIGSFLSLIGQLPSEWTASSPICTLSMLVYPRALSSPLYSSSSSSMTCSPPRILAFTPLLMIPS